MRLQHCIAFLVSFSAAQALADGPADNLAEKVRRVPAMGIEVPEAVRAELTERLASLDAAIDELAKRDDPRVRELLSDVRIFHKAVHDALKHRELFNESEIPVARSLLEQGLARAKQLAGGTAPWTTQTGLVVRGYVSKIDGSVQPYGLVIPESYMAQGAQRHRLDVWFHGRGETLSEVNFLASRQKDRGAFAPADTIVLHPYGRYCNAFKFAGEVDVLEALWSVERRYRIDPDRIAARGFSMGGAACWQFAVHYTDRWVAAAPGAGFSETPDFLRVFQKETLSPPWWERKLWRMYDCNEYALNLLHCPTVAYSGDKDIQKQAADIMEAALKAQGIDLVHIIGPNTAHSYEPGARDEIDRRITSIVERGRDRTPRRVELTTFTLKYNRMHWVRVDGLKEHWEPTRVTADITSAGTLDVATTNVTELSFDFAPGRAPFAVTRPVALSIDGQKLSGPRPRSDRSWSCTVYREKDHWSLEPAASAGLRKRHDLQGPIDDAFMDAFIFVRPTGKARHPAVESWVQSEMDRAIEHWRRQFRGDAVVKNDVDITEDDTRRANLALWGDPESNSVLKRLAGKLPVQWNDAEISLFDRRYPSDRHALVLVYPNPENPQRYLVLNSGFTYRDYDYLNNARQTPKLPDWAVVDLRTPPDARWPGRVVAADFFDERWKLKPAKE